MHFFTNFGEDEQTSMLPLQENLAQAEAERRGHKGARAPHTKFGGHKWPCAPQSKLDEAIDFLETSFLGNINLASKRLQNFVKVEKIFQNPFSKHFANKRVTTRFFSHNQGFWDPLSTRYY